ncbi:MAG: hypothetical protein WHS43_05720 [Aquificaceae bacterium]|jgi:hypothetical protein|uniref:hypothetical protein n=1 Tax=Hydrogenobacter sp. Uz 6-8 TaxID=3384828 RepID=UPI0030ABD500
MLFQVYAQECPLLRVRYLALKEDMIYEDLMREAESLINAACERGDRKAGRSADKILQALENIRFPEGFGKDRVVASKRLRRASLLLNETGKYSKKHPQLYAYQLLFYQVARENYRVGDYEYALKYSVASYNLGRAILELR